MIKNVIFDVDGVLNTGHFVYSKDGKSFKIFGPHDKDGLIIISKYVDNILFVTADKTGFLISHARIVGDWGFSDDQLILLSEADRLGWISSRFDMQETAYMGDGYHDAPIIKAARIGIAPSSGRIEAREAADFVTPSKAGSGAVLDACLYIEQVILNDRM